MESKIKGAPCAAVVRIIRSTNRRKGRGGAAPYPPAVAWKELGGGQGDRERGRRGRGGGLKINPPPLAPRIKMKKDLPHPLASCAHIHINPASFQPRPDRAGGLATGR